MIIALEVGFVILYALAMAAGIGALRGDAQAARVFGGFGLLSALALCALALMVPKLTILYLFLAATGLGVLGGFLLRARRNS